MYLSNLQSNICTGILESSMFSDRLWLYEPHQDQKSDLGETEDDSTNPLKDQFEVDLTKWLPLTPQGVPCQLQTLFPRGDSEIAEQVRSKTLYTVSVSNTVEIQTSYLVVVENAQIQKISQCLILNLEDLRTDQLLRQFTIYQES